MKRSKRSGFPILFKAALILGAFYVGYWFFVPQTGRSPADALGKAWEQLEANNTEALDALLSRAGAEPLIAHWATLGEARLFELQGRTGEAVEKYRSLTQNSAASLDARLALLRLAPLPDVGTSAEAEFGRAINLLENEVRAASRRDLLPELYLLKARSAEHSGNSSFARSLYADVRKRFPRSPAADRARVAMRQIAERQGRLPGERSIAELLSEAALLLEEKKSDEALELTQIAKEKTEEGTPAYYETMLLEEEILRTSGRREEADRELALISADGGPGTGDKALFKMTRLAWNLNQHDRALDFIENFKKRFPESPLLHEVMYAEGRIYEEKLQSTEAKQAYRELSEKSRNLGDRLKALRQIAWIHLREGAVIPAAELFRRAGDDAYGAYETTANERLRRDYFDSYLHFRFWEAHSLSMLTEEDRRKLPNTVKKPTELQIEIAEADPFGYYGLLARRHATEAGAVLRDSTDNDSVTPCAYPIEETFSARLTLLRSANLLQLVQYEIDWQLAQSANTSVQHEQEEELTQAVTRAAWYLDHGLTNRSLGYLDAVLLKPPAVNPFGEKIHTCRDYLTELRFPLPFRPSFEQSAAEHKVDIPLLLAVARTESHFDPAARSPKDARGLLQLLPRTAEEEGLQPGEDLYAPEVNIALGAKHIARLLAQYEGEKVYAIAAYNAGREAVERWRARYPSLPPLAWAELIGYPETKDYVKKVLTAEEGYRRKLNLN